MPPVSEFTTSDGVAIRFACLGTGPPLYVCHGGPIGDRRGLVSQVAALQDRFTLVSHDYRGSGASSIATASTYDFEHLADDLDELRVHLGHARVDVLAHSMGVPVALYFARRHPDSVRRVVLTGGTPLSASRMPWRMMRTLGPRRLLEVEARSLTYLVWWSWRASSPGRDMALIRLSEATGKSDRPFRHPRSEPMHGNDNATSLQRAFMGVDLTHDLDRIGQRVLVLYGERDAIAAAGASKFASLPHVEFAVLPRIGHEIFADAPQLTLERIEAFLDHQPVMGDETTRRSVEIERFRREHQAAVQRLIFEGLEEHWGLLDPQLNPDLEDIETSYAAGAVLVARDAGRIVGVGAIMPVAVDEGEVKRMSVARGMRRQGIGTALLRELAADAKRRGWRCLKLETTADWQDAVEFYRALGLELTHYEDGSFGRDAFFRMDIHSDPSDA